MEAATIFCSYATKAIKEKPRITLAALRTRPWTPSGIGDLSTGCGAKIGTDVVVTVGWTTQS